MMPHTDDAPITAAGPALRRDPRRRAR